MSEHRVKSFYTKTVRQEWKRLVKDAYRQVEYDTSIHFLEKYLPKKGRILDAGCGPGRYSIELARRGYDVVMLDLTPANLVFAKQQIKKSGTSERVEAVIEGSIVDLSQLRSNSFDAVICLGGPLSHVLDEHKRDKAVSELVRVCKKGGVVAVSVMSRLSVLAIELAQFPEEISKSFFKPLRDTGSYSGTSGFTACHFFLPEELFAAFSRKGVTVLEMVGLEGLGSHHIRQVNSLARDKKRWPIWQETHLRTCTHPTAVGISEHMMLLCRKK